MAEPNHFVVTTSTNQPDLKCKAQHEDSGATLITAAPVDNNGDGSSFSPTDLVGVALATCMMTTMAMVAGRKGYDLGEATVRTEKRMSPPPRQIRQLKCTFDLPAGLTEEQRAELRRAAEACPVKRSLDSSVEVLIEFN